MTVVSNACQRGRSDHPTRTLSSRPEHCDWLHQSQCGVEGPALGSGDESSFDEVLKAIDREKQLKRWNRKKKVWLIERVNPTWEDLAAELFSKHMYQPDKRVPPLAS